MTKFIFKTFSTNKNLSLFEINESEEEKKTDKDYAAEELDRILQPIDDEETAKEVSDYKEEDD